MSTSADPSLVLTELPTRPGSVIGRAQVVEGNQIFEVAVLTRRFAKGDSEYVWRVSGEMLELSVADMNVLIRMDDWLPMGHVPLADSGMTEAQLAYANDVINDHLAANQTTREAQDGHDS